jgi:hypothetical protein
MKTARFLSLAFAVPCLAAGAVMADAQTLATAWTDWTKVGAKAVTGELMLPSGAVYVRYSGSQPYFVQFEGDRIDYWTSGDPDPYAVTGRPTGTDIIAFTGGTGDALYRITFSRPVTNPVFAILSLGARGLPARYHFKQAPTLLSSGVGYWGGCADCLQVRGRKVVGAEGHGVVQFMGTFSTITWTEPDYENWHGIQVGAPLEQ